MTKEDRRCIRLACLEQACQLGMAHGNSVLENAIEFERFVIGGAEDSDK